jgi:hypothetical protein
LPGIVNTFLNTVDVELCEAVARVGHVDEAAAGEKVSAAAEVQPLQPPEVSQQEGEGSE